ncbi:hypothetical protein MKW98_017540 [Papaver atlanticum]|uniref:Transcription initiation factor TFIID subunit 8 n=1 Tax=Papaver atlanticum TaxID=357466 RepID=A0AAD4TFP8_9MAGN|nr:hypothetical protein MKW98_017540 [Papaver atlanticum]
MNDGGKENGSQNSNKGKKKLLLNNGGGGGDDFARAIARIAVAQICETTGFETLHESALDALSDIVIRYLCDLGKTAHFYSNLAGRMDSNVFDIIQGLEDLGFSQGFVNSSDMNRCLVESGIVREITDYVNSAKDIPFARTVPRFPFVREPKATPSFLQIGETPAGKHIPAWLPAFPDPHTYIHTPVWNEKVRDPKADKIEQARQRRKAERSLLSLQQRLASSGSELPSSVGKGTNQAIDTNPFLAPPMTSSDNEEESVQVHSSKSRKELVVENRISVLETFAPAIEAASKSGSSEVGDGVSKAVIPLNKKPVVHFKFGIGRKSLGMPVDLTLQNSIGKPIVWFRRDEEKDDKKRRAEQILKEAIENPQDLAQL